MENRFLLLFTFVCVTSVTTINAQSNVAINTTGIPDVSAIFDVNSSSLGLIMPRLTSTQVTTLSAAAALPANGLMVYNTTTNALNINAGTTSTPVFYSILSNNLSSPLIYTPGTGNGTVSGALSIQAATSGQSGYLTTANYGTFNGKQPYLNNTTLATTGFVKGTTTAVGSTNIAYDNLTFNTSTGSAGYYPKYTAASSLGSSLMYEDNSSHAGVNTTTPNSTLQVSGSFATTVTRVTPGATVLNLDENYSTVLVSPGTGVTITVNLPDATLSTGRIYTIKLLTTGGTVYIAAFSSIQSIDAYYYKNNGQQNKYNITTINTATKIQSDGNNWFIIGRYL